jgi:hypothetical protein
MPTWWNLSTLMTIAASMAVGWSLRLIHTGMMRARETAAVERKASSVS